MPWLGQPWGMRGRGGHIPFRVPVDARHLDLLGDFARGDVRDQEAQEVIIVGVDLARILVDDEHPDVVRERNGLDNFPRLHIRDGHNLVVSAT